MTKLIALALCVVLQSSWLCEAAPRALDATDLKNLTALIEPEVPVRYDGAQLWSVNFQDDRTKRIVVDLKKRFGELLYHFCKLTS